MRLAILFILSIVSLIAAEQRIASLHGPLSEITVLLGRGQALVGVDSTSTWPARLKQLPSVGYVRNLSAEGVLSLQADMVLIDESAGPPPVLAQLKTLNLPMVHIPEPKNFAGIPERIRLLGEKLNRQALADTLADAVSSDLAAAKGVVRPMKALFVFHPRGTNLTAAGAGVAGDELMTHVGLQNILAKEKGWLPLQAEAAVAAGPEIIVTTTSALAGIGGHDALVSHPALKQTPAAKNNKIVVLDTMSALGHGPRTGIAALQLARELNPDAKLPASLVEAYMNEQNIGVK